ncbi:hypothetical protein R6Q59_034050 [Mikania micrantha]
MEIDAGDDATAFVISPRDHRARNLWKPNLRYPNAFPETIILSNTHTQNLYSSHTHRSLQSNHSLDCFLSWQLYYSVGWKIQI